MELPVWDRMKNQLSLELLKERIRSLRMGRGASNEDLLRAAPKTLSEHMTHGFWHLTVVASPAHSDPIALIL